jgi:FAD/FMN-containing dehydrogenase/Fe-S oxidoreductase
MTEELEFIKELNDQIEGELHLDPVSKKIYSLDASIYEVEPLAIAIPKTVLDLQNIIRIAAKHRIPVTPRGSATGITGGCLGKGLIVDSSKYLKTMVLEETRAICGPGVIQDELNNALSPLGYRLGPDTSTGDRATLGGMAANNAAGARSLHFGVMADAVESIDLVLSSGEILHFGPLNEEEWNKKLQLTTQEGSIYRAAEEVRTKHKDAILTRFPKLPRRASGYHLDRLLKPFPLNLAELIVGSEGSLGVISSLTVKLAKKPSYLELHLFPFNSMQEAMKAVPELLQTAPMALEMIDDKILRAGKTAPALQGKVEWLQTIPKVLLVAEYGQSQCSRSPLILKEKEAMENVWAVRKNGLGLLLSKRSYSRAIAFIEDVSVPPERLGEFMDRFLSYLEAKGKDAGIYGHAGPGCLHIRPYIDLRNPSEVALMKEIMLDVASMIKEVGGAMSGEHGDGLIRSWLNETLFGKQIIEAFQKIKNAFDPLGLMNPHKIVQPLPLENDLRKAPRQDPATFLKFDGGLALSADLCNGNGACRKMGGVMCPSFQVTHDEYDSTRARANAFRGVMQGEKPSKLDEESLHDILDLCIQCKGCKKECPSSVDMAKMKSEALYHYQEKHGYRLRSALFAHIDSISRLGFPFRGIVNFLAKKFFRWGGISHPPPPFAEKRFSKLAEGLEQPHGMACVLLSDTYTEFYCPEVGVAAIKVLNHIGYQVIVPPWKCCGRPAISKGFLPKAKKNSELLAEQMMPYLEQDIPIIGLEPSCFFTLLDEYPDFLGSSWNPKNCHLFDSFLAKQPLNISAQGQKAALHGHCHHKAMCGMQDSLKVLVSTGAKVAEIPSGCCGMAGSFGYEKEHSDFSKKIGELHLLPFVRSLPEETAIIANGYSCRTQICLHTGRKALHLAEWLFNILFIPD